MTTPQQTRDPDGVWLTVDQLVAMLQITERHVRRLVAERRIPVTRVGRRLRFNPARILDWLDRNSDDPDDGGHGRAARTLCLFKPDADVEDSRLAARRSSGCRSGGS